jgi:membrane fusion protein, multidrug efflux system
MLAVLFGGYLSWQHFADIPGAARSELPPPVPVIAATVQQQNFPIVLTGIGNVTALNSATVRSMVTEQILSIDFKDGQFVNKGQLLAQLDPSTYQAQLDQAEANLARDEAHLKNEQINLGRYIPPQNKALRQSNRSQHSRRKTQEEATITDRAFPAPVKRRKTGWKIVLALESAPVVLDKVHCVK